MSLVTNRNNIFKKGVIGNVRKAQEDSHDMALDTPNGDVFVVCDGMGGHVGGAKASSLAVEYIIKQLKEKKYDDPYQALKEALECANMQILGFANDHPEYKGMGTTACIVLMRNDGAYIAHVGDSRIYIFLGKEKKLHRITKDHSYVQTLVDAEIITDEQAEHHEHKNRILKALGVTPDLQPSYGKVIPKNGDIFLMCSDGLSGMIPDSTIEKVLGHNSTLEAKGDLLIKLAMQGETVQPGGQDNCTLELIQIDNSPWPKSEFESFNPLKSGKKNPKSFPKIVKIIAFIVALVVALGVAAVCLKVWHEEGTIESQIIDVSIQINNKEKIIDSIEGQLDSYSVLLKQQQSDVENKKGEQKKTAQEKVRLSESKIDSLNTKRDEVSKRIDSLINVKDSLEDAKKNILKNKIKSRSNEGNNNR